MGPDVELLEEDEAAEEEVVDDAAGAEQDTWSSKRSCS
jgi:hypothetical protein